MKAYSQIEEKERMLYIEPDKYREVRVGIEKQILKGGVGMDLCREVSSRWQRTALESRFLHLYSFFLHMIIEQRQADCSVVRDVKDSK